MWTALLTADKSTYMAGEPIVLTLRLVNGTREPVSLTFHTGQRFDFVVRNQEGREVWRWAAGRMFTQVLGQETVPPSGALVYTATVEKPLLPGGYTVTGLVTAPDGVPSASLTFRVEPRP